MYGRLVEIFEKEEDRQAVQVFLNWFEQLAIRGYRPLSDYESVERKFETIEEVKSMLMTAIERDREQMLKTGKVEGKKEQQVLSAQRMIAKGYSLPTIAELLALSEEEVQLLLAQPHGD